MPCCGNFERRDYYGIGLPDDFVQCGSGNKNIRARFFHNCEIGFSLLCFYLYHFIITRVGDVFLLE